MYSGPYRFSTYFRAQIDSQAGHDRHPGKQISGQERSASMMRQVNMDEHIGTGPVVRNSPFGILAGPCLAELRAIQKIVEGFGIGIAHVGDDRLNEVLCADDVIHAISVKVVPAEWCSIRR